MPHSGTAGHLQPARRRTRFQRHTRLSNTTGGPLQNQPNPTSLTAVRPAPSQWGPHRPHRGSQHAEDRVALRLLLKSSSPPPGVATYRAARRHAARSGGPHRPHRGSQRVPPVHLRHPDAVSSSPPPGVATRPAVSGYPSSTTVLIAPTGGRNWGSSAGSWSRPCSPHRPHRGSQLPAGRYSSVRSYVVLIAPTGGRNVFIGQALYEANRPHRPHRGSQLTVVEFVT